MYNVIIIKARHKFNDGDSATTFFVSKKTSPFLDGREISQTFEEK